MARDIGKGTVSAYPQPARFGNLFRAVLSEPVSPSATADVVKQIIESGTWKLRHPTGPDAAALLAWRASKPDEEFVDWSAQNDDEWYAAVEREFGTNARPNRGTTGKSS